MPAKKLVGAIIAGGRGTRFNPISLTTPKALLPICNKSIIMHQIDYLKELQIEEVFIVVGCLKEQIMERLGDGREFGIKIRYVIQEKPEGSGHAVGLLEEYIDANFVLFLGDISIKINRILKHLRHIYRSHRNNVSLLACKIEEDFNRLRQNFAIILDSKKRVLKVIEKPDEPPTKLKGCGVYLFTPEIFKAIRNTPRSGKRNEYELTNAIQTLIDSGQSVYPIEIIDWDVNISSAEELYRCNYLWFNDMRLENLIGRDCKINTGARIENSIIGDCVEVVNAIKIKDSIIFSNTVINRNMDLADRLITSEHEIQI